MNEMSLRVSVASLVRVVFPEPKTGGTMLALERKVTYWESEQRVVVRVQPLGGAMRIHDLAQLRQITGGFRFDSEHSRDQEDFRILIRPSAWNALRDFCLDQLQRQDNSIIETSPVRELAEEFEDSLKISLNPDQYAYDRLWTVLENNPIQTGNIHAAGQPTVRIYRVFEARILDPTLWQAISLNSQKYSDQDLQNHALEDLHKGGKGRANAFLTLPLESLCQFYQSLSPEQRNPSVKFGDINLEGNVPALLEGITVPKFQRF